MSGSAFKLLNQNWLLGSVEMRTRDLFISAGTKMSNLFFDGRDAFAVFRTRFRMRSREAEEYAIRARRSSAVSNLL